MTPARPGPQHAGRLLNHAAHGLIGWAAPLAVTFITTPLIVHGLGADGFAIYAWTAAFAAGIATAGPARGVLHLVSRSSAVQARQEAIATGLWIAVGLSASAAGVTWALSHAAASIAQLPPGSAIPALQIAVMGAVPAAVIAVCLNALQGLKQFGTAAALTSVTAVLTATGAAWVATTGQGVVTVVSWVAAASVVVSVASLVVLRRRAGSLSGGPTRTAASGIARFGVAAIGTQLIYAAWLVVERTLVGRYLGSQMLTALVVGLMLSIHAHGAIVSAMQVLASLGPGDGSDSDDRLVRAYPSATILSAIVAVAFAALIAGLGVPALTLWIGTETATRAEPLLLPLAIGVGLNGLAVSAWFANEAEGRPLRNLAWAATGLILTTITLLWLAPAGNAAAAGIARVVSVAPAPLYIAWTEASSAGRLRAPWLRILAYVIPSGIVLFAGFRMVAAVASGSWLVLIAAAAIGLAAYVSLLWRLPLLAERDRLSLRSWLNAFIG